MPERRENFVARAQILVNCLGLGRRFYHYDIHAIFSGYGTGIGRVAFGMDHKAAVDIALRNGQGFACGQVFSVIFLSAETGRNQKEKYRTLQFPVFRLCFFTYRVFGRQVIPLIGNPDARDHGHEKDGRRKWRAIGT